jgi:hypothetical protein
MTEQTPLSEILNDEPAAEAPQQETAEQPIEAEPTEAEPGGRERDERGRFKSKGEEESAPPAPQDEAAGIPVAALKDERSKRQALETELEQLRASIAQQPQQEPQAPPDRWEDPDGYDQYLIQQAAHYAREQAVHAFNQQRIHQSAVRARGKYDDYDHAHQVFGEMVQRNPALMDQMLTADDPAEYAYNEAKSEIAIRSAGGLQAYIQQEAARLVAAQQPTIQDVASRLPPPTISDSRNVGSRSSAPWQGPTPLSDILR